MKSERALSSASLTPGASTAPWHCHQMARAEHHSLHHDPPQIPNPPSTSFPGTQSPLLPKASTFWSETLKTHGHGKAASVPCPAAGLPGFLPALASLQQGKAEPVKMGKRSQTDGAALGTEGSKARGFLLAKAPVHSTRVSQ